MGALAWHLHSTPESSPSERGLRGDPENKGGVGSGMLAGVSVGPGSEWVSAHLEAILQ